MELHILAYAPNCAYGAVAYLQFELFAQGLFKFWSIRYSPFHFNQILNSTNIEEWQYVPTKSNVADDATRYKQFCDLNSNSRCLMGLTLHITTV